MPGEGAVDLRQGLLVVLAARCRGRAARRRRGRGGPWPGRTAADGAWSGAVRTGDWVDCTADGRDQHQTGRAKDWRPRGRAAAPTACGEDDGGNGDSKAEGRPAVGGHHAATEVSDEGLALLDPWC